VLPDVKGPSVAKLVAKSVRASAYGRSFTGFRRKKISQQITLWVPKSRRQAANRALQLGVSRSWASREANASGTRNIIADLFKRHRERLELLFDRTLAVIDDAMEARQFLVMNRVLVEVGPITACGSKPWLCSFG